MTQHTNDPTLSPFMSQRSQPTVEVLDGPLYTRDQVHRVVLRVGAACAVIGIGIGYWLGRGVPRPEAPR